MRRARRCIEDMHALTLRRSWPMPVALVLAVVATAGAQEAPPGTCGYETWADLSAVSDASEALTSKVSHHTAQLSGAGVGCTPLTGGGRSCSDTVWVSGQGAPGMGGGSGGDGGMGPGRSTPPLPAVINPFLGAFMPKFGADLARRDTGFTWFSGVTHNGRQEQKEFARHNSNGPQGYNWMQDGHPELVDAGDGAHIFLAFDANSRLTFRRPTEIWPPDEGLELTDTYLGTNGTHGMLVRREENPDGVPANGDEIQVFEYTDRSGRVYTFFGFSGAGFASGSNARAKGHLWKVVDADGDDSHGSVSYVGHATNATSAMTSGFAGTAATPLGIATAYSENYKFVYTYSGPIAGKDRLTSVEVFASNGSGGWETAHSGRVDYAYYTSTVSGKGTAGDLKTITTTVPLSESGETITRTRYFRYYTGVYDQGVNDGAAHLIKLVVDDEGIRRYGSGYEAESDANLKAYAAYYLTYIDAAGVDGTPGVDLQVRTAFASGQCGCSGSPTGLFTYTYEANGNYTTGDDDDLDDKPWGSTGAFDWSGDRWFSRTIIHRPDQSYQILYFDRWGQVLADVIADGDPTETSPAPNFWVTKHVRDLRGRIVLTATPNAIESYTHSTGEIVIDTDAGLVLHKTYTQSEGPLADAVFTTAHSQGRDGTKYLDSYTLYDTGSPSKSFEGVPMMRALPAAVRRYHGQVELGGVDENNGAYFDVTLYDYTYYQDSTPTDIWLIKSITTTLEAVATADNGEGVTHSSVAYLRRDGTTAFTKAINGVISYTGLDAHDRAVRTVQDMDLGDTALFVGSEDHDDWGITLPASGAGITRTTEYAYDKQGRIVTMTMPNGRVTLQHHTKLSDGRMVSISLPKFVDDTTDVYFGPASIAVINQAGKAEVSATLVLGNGSISASTSAITAWVNTADADLPTALDNGIGSANHALWRMSTSIFDESGTRLEFGRTYHTDPTSLPGTIGTDYDQTAYTYDNMGRVELVVDPTGTGRETDFDALGRVVARHIGDDTSRELTETLEYDGGGVGNSHLTSRTLHPTSDPGDDRTTTYLHDFRGRTIVAIAPQAPHSVTAYDNLNRVTATATYASDSGLTAATEPTTVTNRLSYATSEYDSRGRVFRSRNYEVNQPGMTSPGQIRQISSTNVSQISETWYSSSGDVVQTRGPSVQKHAYDRLRRRTRTYTILEADRTYSNVYDHGTLNTVTTGDVVLEEHQTHFDSDTNNVLWSASIQRHHQDNPTDSMSPTTGPLDSNADNDGSLLTMSNVLGRVQIAATFYDDLERPRITAFYGTNGGTNFSYPGTAPSPSATMPASVLVTATTYNAAGLVTEVEDPRERVTRTVYDFAGRRTQVISNDVTSSPGVDTQSVFYEYASGLMTAMWVDMDHNGSFSTASTPPDQKTVYEYGVLISYPGGDDTQGSLVNVGSWLKRVIYPDSTGTLADSVRYAYNRLGEQIWTRDQLGTVVATSYDGLGREGGRSFTSVGSGLSTWVRALSTTYDSRGLVVARTQYANANYSSPLNELTYEYDRAGNLSVIHQDNNSVVDALGSDDDYTTVYAYELSDYSDTSGVASMYRLQQMTYPDGTELAYVYSESGSYDHMLSRVGEVTVADPDLLYPSSIPVAQYRYSGTAMLIEQYLPEPEAYTTLDNYGGSYGVYPRLDRFNRITESSWWRDTGGGPTLQAKYYEADLTYDNASNILSWDDGVFNPFNATYTVDGMSRLLTATATRQTEAFNMDRAGNLLRMKLDGNADADYDDAWGEFDDERTFNRANELVSRSWDAATDDARSPEYDAVGNLILDDALASGQGLQYQYDALGRLVRIQTNESTPTVLALFEYDANNQRIAWTHPRRNGGAGGMLETRHEAVYDHRWRMIEVRRDETEDGNQTGNGESEQGRFERFYYHAAGVAGSGNSVYIDSVIARDRSIGGAILPELLGERTYYAQNWRGDVVQLMRPDGSRVEGVRYSAYGRPFNIRAAEIDANGVVDLIDFELFAASWDTHYGTTFVGTGDHNLDGYVDEDDYDAYLDDWVPHEDIATGRDVLTMGQTFAHGGNRKGYAGYEHEPWWYEFPTSGTPPTEVPNVEAGPLMQLARHRFYRADLGTWTRRDPLGYVDGSNLSSYSRFPIKYRDPFGLFSYCIVHSDDIQVPAPPGWNNPGIGRELNCAEYCSLLPEFLQRACFFGCMRDPPAVRPGVPDDMGPPVPPCHDLCGQLYDPVWQALEFEACLAGCNSRYPDPVPLPRIPDECSLDCYVRFQADQLTCSDNYHREADDLRRNGCFEGDKHASRDCLEHWQRVRQTYISCMISAMFGYDSCRQACSNPPTS